MLILYGHPLSSPTNKIRFFLNLENIPYDFKLVDLIKQEHKQTSFLKMNSFGLVPVIDDEGFYLSESNAILRYLADRFQSNLFPKGLKARALIDRMMDYSGMTIANLTAKIMFHRYICHYLKVAPNPRVLSDAQEELAEEFSLLEKMLAQSKYLVSDQLSLADLALLSALDVCEVIQVSFSEFPALDAWRKNLMQMPFYQQCHTRYSDVFLQQWQQKK